ncbi:MAG: hypothetical protein LUI13_04330 [Lachnospiraceae bacterium]|nr:hypothetical protein [Lachnospiraceae bacterium]
MGKEMVKYIVYAAAMCLVGWVTGYLHNRSASPDGTVLDGGSYVLKFPKALTGVFAAVMMIGMLSFAFVAVSRCLGTPSATIELIRVSLGFAAVGLAMMLWSMTWSVRVTGEQMEIHRFLRRTQLVTFAEIERVDVSKRFQLLVYRDGRRLVTVDLLAENYDRFTETLEKYGKLNRKAAGV